MGHEECRAFEFMRECKATLMARNMATAQTKISFIFEDKPVRGNAVLVKGSRPHRTLADRYWRSRCDFHQTSLRKFMVPKKTALKKARPPPLVQFHEGPHEQHWVLSRGDDRLLIFIM